VRLSPPSDDLAARLAARLDARLRTDPAAPPLAVGFSGGGDSLALLLVADAWARAWGRALHVFTVDHGLQAQSRDWTAACARTAAALGRPFTALSWTGTKPARGLPAAARAARHRLLADAARTVGAQVVLLGHTADDLSEAESMRAAGSTTPSPREWGPSPAWPEGRGIFLCRPMLALGRAEIRKWLVAQGRNWIDDPANDDFAYARARARAAPVDRSRPAAPQEPPPGLADFAACFAAEPWGGLRLDRGAARAVGPATLKTALGAACLSVSGGVRPPRGDRVERLGAALAGAAPVVQTLAGARIVAKSASVLVLREPGEIVRQGGGVCALPPGAPMVWDGRYELTAPLAGLAVRRLAGLAQRLSAIERRALARLPAAARGALPAVIDPDGAVSCPLLSEDAGVVCRPLASARFAAACGQVRREP